MLHLLEPLRVSVDRTGNVSVWTPSRGGELGVERAWILRTVWVKMLKSCILIRYGFLLSQTNILELMDITITEADYDDWIDLS